MSNRKMWSEEDSPKKQSWFGGLSLKRKLIYSFLLLFVASWCFFLGFHAAGLMQEAKAGEDQAPTVSGTALNNEEDLFLATDLTGFRTVLAVGYDVREGYQVGRSDTIMVAFLNLDDKSVKLLSIPRDSYVYIPGGFGRTKINHAFSYGGVTLVKETVEYLLGITIDDYVSIDFQGFQDVVDAVGGVELYVDRKMVNWNEGIELYPGTHLLNGKQALGFCRYRGADCSDYDRIKHQQYFLRCLLKKLMSFSTLTKISELVDIFMANVDTSISSSQMLQLARYAFSMDLENMEVYTVPGYSMYIQYGGAWLSHEIINRSELTSILNKIAGDDITFSPNVISPGEDASYTIPDGEEELIDDDAFSGGEGGEGGAVDGGEGGSNNGSGEGGDSGSSGGDNGSGSGDNGSGGGDNGSGGGDNGGQDFGQPVDNGDTVGGDVVPEG